MLGIGGGTGGTSIQGPQQANIGYETNSGQINNAYQSANQGLLQQQSLLQALQGQNGLSNQNQVYGQLQNVAAGQGPNPATALLSNATGANNAAQAALMAGQRGASSNVGLIARQAAQQGAANQQNAVGQAAALQAQQSLGALGQAGQMANTQAGQQIAGTGALTSATQAEQQNILNAQAAQNQAMVGSQSSVNSANSAMAQSQASQQSSGIGGVLGGLGSLAMLAANGGQIERFADGGLSGATNSIVPVTSGPQKPGMLSSFLAATGTGIGGGAKAAAANSLQSGLTQFGAGIGHLLGGSSAPQPLQMPTTGTVLPASTDNMLAAPVPDASAMPTETAMAAEGGDISDKAPAQAADPEPVPSTYAPTEAPATTSGPRSSVGKILSGVFSAPSLPSTAPQRKDPQGALLQALGGETRTSGAPGSTTRSSNETSVGFQLKKGGHVPGQAKVPGPVNSYDNDTVNAKLSPGEIVIPNSVTKSSDPVRGAAEFVARTIAKKKIRGGK